MGTQEGLGPEKKRGEEKVPGRREGPKDLEVGLHRCLVAHFPWPLLLLAKFSFTPGVLSALGSKSGAGTWRH